MAAAQHRGLLGEHLGDEFVELLEVLAPADDRQPVNDDRGRAVAPGREHPAELHLARRRRHLVDSQAHLRQIALGTQPDLLEDARSQRSEALGAGALGRHLGEEQLTAHAAAVTVTGEAAGWHTAIVLDSWRAWSETVLEDELQPFSSVDADIRPR